MGAHPLCASACVGYVGLVAHSQNIGIGIGMRCVMSCTAVSNVLVVSELWREDCALQTLLHRKMYYASIFGCCWHVLWKTYVNLQ